MARYGEEHKAATRQRIIETAGRRLKQDGIDGSGVAALMADAGLTNGAFYAHFASKDDLVATAIGEQLREQRARYRIEIADRAGIERLVRAYLSPEHRDNPGEGCPSAALLDEIGRSSDATRHLYTEGMLGIADHIASVIEPRNPSAGRAQALALFASMIGTLQLSRALADRQLADALLEQGIHNAVALLELPARRRRPVN